MIERINLLPPEQRAGIGLPVELRWFALIFLLLCAGLAAVTVYESRSVRKLAVRKADLDATRRHLEGEIARFGAALERRRGIAAEQEILRLRLRSLELLEDERYRWSEVLSQISRLVPKGSWLTGFGSYPQAGESRLSRRLKFQGKALSHALVSDLLAALEGSPGFRDFELLSVKKGFFMDREVVDFELTCRREGGGGG